MSGKYNEKSKSISCTVCNECGGCCYTDIPYEETLRIKQNKVNSLFKNIYVTFAENKDYFFNRNRICFKKFDDALTITNKLNDIIEPLFVLAKLSN